MYPAGMGVAVRVLALLSVVVLLACEQGTYLLITVESDRPLSVTTLHVILTRTRDGKQPEPVVFSVGTPFPLGPGQEVRLPLQLEGDRAGQIDLTVHAFSASGSRVAVASLPVEIVQGRTNQVTVTLGPPPPVLTGATPRCGTTAGGGSLTVTGADFGCGLGLGVEVGGRSATVTKCSPNQLELTLPATLRSGPTPLLVRNPDRQTAQRNDLFCYRANLALGQGTLHGTGELSWDLAVGDWDGDGKPDIAYTNVADVRVLRGAGDGRFTAGQTIAGLPGAAGIASLDCDDDHKLDLVVAADWLHVLRGEGTGMFRPPMNLAGAGTELVVADVDADGRQDLVVVGGLVTILRGQGGCVFAQPPITRAAGMSPTGVTVGHLDNDEKLDIVVSNGAEDSVTVLFGNGKRKDVPVGRTPNGPVVTDLDGDGAADLVVTNEGDSTVSVLPGDGAGGFGAPRVLPTGGPASTVPQGGIVGDLNGDCLPDLVTTSCNQESAASVLLGKGDSGCLPAGTFEPAREMKGQYGCTGHGALADFDGDGRLDLAIANLEPAGGVVVLMNTSR